MSRKLVLTDTHEPPTSLARRRSDPHTPPIGSIPTAGLNQQAGFGHSFRAQRASKEISADAKVKGRELCNAQSHLDKVTPGRYSAPIRTPDEAAGILVAGGAIGCAVAGMKLPRAREDKTVALEAYFDRISAADLSRLKLMMEQAGMLADAARDSTGHGARNGI